RHSQYLAGEILCLVGFFSTDKTGGSSASLATVRVGGIVSGSLRNRMVHGGCAAYWPADSGVPNIAHCHFRIVTDPGPLRSDFPTVRGHSGGDRQPPVGLCLCR